MRKAHLLFVEVDPLFVEVMDPRVGGTKAQALPADKPATIAMPSFMFTAVKAVFSAPHLSCRSEEEDELRNGRWLWLPVCAGLQ